jgi:hypothetical protein
MLIGARRTGKTSLVHRLLPQLKQNCIPVFVDLMPFKKCGNEWYAHVAQRILEQLQEHISLSRSKRTKLLGLASDHIGFSRFLETVAKEAKPTRRIVMMLDEIGLVPPDIADPLFRSLRAEYVSMVDPENDRYTFVFAGACDPIDLIKGDKGSIFDFAEKVNMTDADVSGVRQLVALLDPNVNDKLVRHFYHWTGGHLYLTQRLCSILDDQGTVRITRNAINQAVDDIIADDDSIAHIKEMLSSSKSVQSSLKRVLAGKRLGWSNTMARKLNIIGVVKKGRNDNCIIRNRIFEKVLREYFQEECPDEQKGRSLGWWVQRVVLGIAFVALPITLWLFLDLSDVVQGWLLDKSNETSIVGLQDSNGVSIEATIYSPRLLDSGQPQNIDIVVHSHEKPQVEFVPHHGSGIIVIQDKTNPYKAVIEWRG